MRCNHCGQPLPEDSKFCQYCGEKISLEAAQSSEAAAVTAEKMTVDIAAEEKPVAVNETQEKLNTEPQKPISISSQKNRTEKKGRSKASAVIPWVLFLLTAICTGLLLIHAVQIQKQTEVQQLKIEELQTQISELENTVESQKSVIEDQTAKISKQTEEHAEEKKKADMFDLLCSGLRSGKIGTGSEEFKVSDGVVILSKGTSKKIDLITAWGEGGGTIDFYITNDCCTIDFTEDSWYDSTKLFIKGNSVGVSIATFFNTANSDTFKVVIIVTE